MPAEKKGKSWPKKRSCPPKLRREEIHRIYRDIERGLASTIDERWQFLETMWAFMHAGNVKKKK